MAVTLHHGTTFLVSDDVGDVEASRADGYFFEDVRCLSSMRMRIDGEPLVGVAAEVSGAGGCTHFCSNANTPDLSSQSLIVVRKRTLDGAFREELHVESRADGRHRVRISFELEADFADIYEVKKQALAGTHDPRRKRTPDLAAEGAHVTLEWRTAGVRCLTDVVFSTPPTIEGTTACFDVELGHGDTWTLTLEISAKIEHPGATRSTRSLGRPAQDGRRARLDRDSPSIETDHPILAEAYACAAHDLVALRLKAEENIDGEYAIAAGIPWYMALFGRDSLIASYQSVLHDPELARGTLTALAHLQGRRVDVESEEQPGRILHEYRKHLRASVRRNIPKFPYYGTIDATPLWIVTLSEYVRCTGDLELARTLWPNVERALSWIDEFGDCDGDGFVEYRTREGGFLVNEGWKDSFDSVRFRDGTIAKKAIALVEVQGYVADAWARVAELADDLGRGADAVRLRKRAAEMRRRIVERYWMDERRFFAEALDGDKRRVDALTSNPGHLLWSRALDDREHARAVAEALLGPDMLTSWGVRTMGSREGGFNPISYHDGSIWPHDNALLLQGLSRYDLHDETSRLAGALLDALASEGAPRFPELYSGFGRETASRPLPYPNANEPQAWASGAVPLIVRAVAGLEVDAVRRRVRVRPSRLPNASFLRVRDVPIAGARATLDVRFDGDRVSARVDGLPPGFRVET